MRSEFQCSALRRVDIVDLPRIGVDASLTERTYTVIRDAILDNKLVPDQVLYEAQIADQLGVSRTPLRAALQILIKEHLVIPLPGKGYRVASLSYKDMQNVFFMRRLLEPAAAGLAAINHSPDDILDMMKAISQQEEALKAGDYPAYLTADRHFHLAIARASQNPYLVSDCTTVQLHGYRFLLLPRFIRARTLTSVQEHTDIARSIEARDRAKAEALLTDHIDKTIQMLESLSADDARK